MRKVFAHGVWHTRNKSGAKLCKNKLSGEKQWNRKTCHGIKYIKSQINPTTQHSTHYEAPHNRIIDLETEYLKIRVNNKGHQTELIDKSSGKNYLQSVAPLWKVIIGRKEYECSQIEIHGQDLPVHFGGKAIAGFSWLCGGLSRRILKRFTVDLAKGKRTLLRIFNFQQHQHAFFGNIEFERERVILMFYPLGRLARDQIRQCLRPQKMLRYFNRHGFAF